MLLILRRTAGVTVKKVNVWKKALNISTYDHFDDDDLLDVVWHALADDPALGPEDGYRQARA